MNTQANKDIVIIGGGIAGLSAAWYLQEADPTRKITLLEASGQVGGKVLSQTLETPSGKAIVEAGPDGFLTRKPWALALAREISLDNEIIPLNKLPERIYILTKKGLIPLPQGLQLLVPSDMGAFLRSPLFSWSGKLRILMEQFIPPKADNVDESLADFITRRMGAEALDKLGEPLLAGVYNVEPHKQSILATFPNFRKLEFDHGSLIGGMRALQSKNNPASDEVSLVSFKAGMGTFAQALAKKLNCEIRLNTSVKSISGADGQYLLELASGENLQASDVIIATTASIAAQLLQFIAPQSSQGLADIPYAGIASVSLAYRKSDVKQAMDAAGVVIPSSLGRKIDGIQWSSAKWEHRAPDDIALIRAFYGGPQTRAMLEQDEATTLTIVKGELADIMNIQWEALAHCSLRWESGYPQYNVGHIERVNQIEASLPQGIYLAGNAYRGIGLPDTIHLSQQVAKRVIKHAIKS